MKFEWYRRKPDAGEPRYILVVEANTGLPGRFSADVWEFRGSVQEGALSTEGVSAISSEGFWMTQPAGVTFTETEG